MRGLLGLDGIASAVCSFTFLSQKLLLAYGDRRHERTNEHQRRRLRRRVKSDLGPGDSSLAGVAPQPTTLHATHSAHSTTWAAVAPLSHHGRAIQATRSILRGSSTLPPSSTKVPAPPHGLLHRLRDPQYLPRAEPETETEEGRRGGEGDGGGGAGAECWG